MLPWWEYGFTTFRGRTDGDPRPFRFRRHSLLRFDVRKGILIAPQQVEDSVLSLRTAETDLAGIELQGYRIGDRFRNGSTTYIPDPDGEGAWVVNNDPALPYRVVITFLERLVRPATAPRTLPRITPVRDTQVMRQRVRWRHGMALRQTVSERKVKKSSPLPNNVVAKAPSGRLVHSIPPTTGLNTPKDVFKRRLWKWLKVDDPTGQNRQWALAPNTPFSHYHYNVLAWWSARPEDRADLYVQAKASLVSQVVFGGHTDLPYVDEDMLNLISHVSETPDIPEDVQKFFHKIIAGQLRKRTDPSTFVPDRSLNSMQKSLLTDVSCHGESAVSSSPYRHAVPGWMRTPLFKRSYKAALAFHTQSTSQ